MNNVASLPGCNNALELTNDGVWVLSDGRGISYSDGAVSEAYLRQVFTSAQDLSSDSYELERWIKDWPSEYHLSRKRTQLLKGFEFRSTDRVLEVGCGCGAITRFLGETFESVVAVEGGAGRARLARLRTRDLPGVSIICAPFQDLTFDAEFDLVFCIGVLEYSGSFVKAPDPYDAFMERMARALKPNGKLIIAIENQFGLKYFSSAREDHTNAMFEGIEDYPRYGTHVRTFGYQELKDKLARHFDHSEFFFPYPDYKLPELVLREPFLHAPNASKLVTRSPSRDYGMPMQPLFNEASAAVALARNRQLPFFSNSFLVYASKAASDVAPFPDLGRMYSDRRPEHMAALTRIRVRDDGSIVVAKTRAFPSKPIPDGVPARFVESVVAWESGPSFDTTLRASLLAANASPRSVYDGCQRWLQELRSKLIPGSPALLPGIYLDAIFQNTFIDDEGCRFVDLEWEWHEPLPLNVLVIRAFYVFFARLSEEGLGHRIGGLVVRDAIRRAGAELGLELTAEDFRQFVRVESALYDAVSLGGRQGSAGLGIRMFLASRLTVPAVRSGRQFVRRVQLQGSRVIRGLRRISRL